MLYIKDGKTFRALQFIVTREVQCKYGTHKDYNSMDIAILMKTALNVHFDKEGPYFYLGDKTENVVVRIGDYVVMDEEGKVYHYTREVFEKEFVSIDDYYNGEDEHPKSRGFAKDIIYFVCNEDVEEE